MTNDTYTHEQYSAAIGLDVHANDFGRCKCGALTRCEHARDMEEAARAFLVSLADAQAIEDTKPTTKCTKCERAEIHAVGLEGTLRRRNRALEQLQETIAKRDERIAELEATPHGLTDKQVGALNTAHGALLERYWEISEALEEAFPEVFTPEPEHPRDEADLKPGDVVVFKLDGEKTISAVQDWTKERRRWTRDADRITDWQVFRPTWTKDGEEA